MAPSANTNGINGLKRHLALDLFSTYTNIINSVASETSQTRHGINPATRQPLPPVPVSTKEDVEKAVRAARKAFKSWRNVSQEERREAVEKFADALEAEQEGFAKLLTMEQGKPLSLAEGEIAAGYFWMKELAKIAMNPEVVSETEKKQTITRYTALVPVHLACGKIAPALITGNTIIIKPSPFTPYCGIKLVELAQSFFPPGVIQVLSGDDSLGPLLTEHPDVDKISFTGSTATGKRIMMSAAGTLKRITLELGGNDPAIVCADVDIEATAQKIATLAFLNSGQICMALKRIYIHSSIYYAFRDAVVRFTKTLTLGDGLEPSTTHGPLQNAMQYERVQGFFADIEKQKWTAAVGGKNDENAKGYFITPTIINNPEDDARIVTDEPFGPIVPILSWTEESEVIVRANNTKMGLGASVWTRDLEQGRRIAEQLESGNVWINSHLEVSPNATFGGHKQSGIGSEWGLSGLKSFCNAQTLFLEKA